MRRKTTERRYKSRKRFLIPIFIVVLLITVFIANTIQTTDFFSFLMSSGPVASTDHGWNLILVNQNYRVPNNWDINLTELSNGQSVDSRIYPELQQMFNDARAQGVYPVVASGYRTSKEQQELTDEKVANFISQGYSRSDAKTEALKWVSAVGYSEHQTGLAVDINADGVKSTGQAVYDWLANNAWKYGFILRYPKDKTDLTGTSYEPWHYRYVGKEASADIYTQKLCLEEYIDTLQ